MATHRRSDDGHAPSLVPEHQTGGTKTVVCAVEVNGADVVPVLDAVVQTPSLRGNASIGDHHIEATEVLDDLRHGSLDRAIITDVDLVGVSPNTEVLANLLRQVTSLLRRIVPDSQLHTTSLEFPDIRLDSCGKTNIRASLG